MSEPAISIHGVGKEYRIGARQERYRTLRDTIAEAFRWRAREPGADFPSRTPSPLPASGSDLFWALKDVSFDIQPGEVVGVIGRNGAGKSTLLKILSQITCPTEGLVEIRGRVGSLLEVGTGFHPELTGRENVFLNGAILGMKRTEIKRKFDEIVAFAEVDQFIDTPVKRYSSGMHVRLAFAVAAHLDPEILLIDEVLAVGDVQFQRKCLGKMSEVACKEGRTILFVSHNMPTVERLCSRCVLLRDGKVAEDGPTESVLRTYLDADLLPQYEWRRDPLPFDHPCVTRITLINHDGSPLRNATTGSAIGLEIECATPHPDPHLQLGVRVDDSLGGAVMSVNPLDDGKPYPVEAGRHRYRALFPAEIFLPQRYSVTVALYAHRTNVDFCPNAVTFDVVPVASSANIVDGGRPGVVFIRCNWTHDVMSLHESSRQI